MADTGFVLFHRKIEEWEWYTEPNVFRLFFHLILKANHEDYKWKGQDIKRGQLITSSEHLAQQLGLSRQKVRTALKKLNGQEITSETTNQFTLVTIENYELYQAKKKKETNELTNEQPTDNQRITTNNNGNHDNNENKPIVDCESLWKLYPKKEGKAVFIKKMPPLIKKYGAEQMKNTILRYIQSKGEDSLYFQHGSTFANNGYVDYLDENYKQEGNYPKWKIGDPIIM